MKKSIIIILCLNTILCLFNSCISRLSRPAITGYIYDYDNKPIPGCKVGETHTDENGKFYLKEIRSSKFLLSEIMVMEAPPLFFELDIEKPGYQSYSKDFFSRYGGGRTKGAIDNLDTLYIKRISEVIQPEDYIYDNWQFVANKNLDTLFGINKNYRLQNPITNNPNFDNKFNGGLLHRFENPVKPDTAWSPESYDIETSYLIKLNKDGTYKGKKTITYQNAWRHRKEYDRMYRESYTIPNNQQTTKGRFKFSKNMIHFDSAFYPSNNLYKIDSIDRDIMILTRIESK